MWTIEYCSSSSFLPEFVEGEALVQQRLAADTSVRRLRISAGTKSKAGKPWTDSETPLRSRRTFPRPMALRRHQRKPGRHGHRQVLDEKLLSVVKAAKGIVREGAVRARTPGC